MSGDPPLSKDYLTPPSSFIRSCRQCGQPMKELLKVGLHSYMFCSKACKDIWDEQRTYVKRMRTDEL